MSDLTARQRRAARHLARGLTQATTGERVGVSRRTIQNWLQDVPGFREATIDPEAAASNADPAETLEDLLNDPDPKIRLAASTALLRLTEAGDIQPPQPPPEPTGPREVKVTIYEAPAKAR